MSKDASSLLDRAAEIAATQKQSQALAQAREEATARYHQKQLHQMKFSVLAELLKLQGQETRYGTLSLNTENQQFSVFAYLQAGNRKLAWFKGEVVSGTFTASDDCRDEPYTRATVWMRIYPPHGPKNGTWDVQELASDHGGQTEYCDDVDKLPDFFDKLAMHLAAWL